MLQDKLETNKIDISLLSISISFILIAAMTIILISFSIYENKQTFDEFSSEIKVIQKKIEFANQIKLAGYQTGYIQNLMVFTEDPFRRDELFLEFNRYVYSAGFARNQLKQLIVSTEEQTLFDIQGVLINKIGTVQDDVFTALNNEDFERAALLRRQAFDKGRFQEVFDSLDNMIKLQKENEKLLLEQAEGKFETTILQSGMILIAIVLIILFIAIYVLKRIKSETIQIKETFSELEQNRSELLYLSLHDTLTKLPNRSYFYQKATECIEKADNNQLNDLFILFFDLDKFKQVNDTLGHEAGDELLKKVANRLNKTFSDTIFIARVGGDEFAALVDSPKDGCEKIALKIVSLIKESFKLTAGIAQIGSSIGISQFQKECVDVDILIRKADISMYYAKQSGGNSIRFALEEDEQLYRKTHEKIKTRSETRT